MEISNESSENKSNMNTSLNRKNCNICNISDIHTNDFANHCNGRSHQRKLRETQIYSDEEPPIVQFHCKYCKRNFTGKQYYSIHLGTKTHRRNLRKNDVMQGDANVIEKRVGTKLVSHLVVDHFEPPLVRAAVIEHPKQMGRRLHTNSLDIHDANDFTYTRKKYKTSTSTIQDLNYKSYIYSLTGFLSVRLALNQNVHNFLISVNDKDWGIFGDITISVSYKEKDMIYAIQCKKVNHAFQQQLSSLEQAKVYMDKEYDQIAALKAKGRDISKTKFLIITTYSTGAKFCRAVTLKPKVLNRWKTGADLSEDGLVQLKHSSNKNELINVTGESDNVFSFILTQNVECILPQVFLYTNQRIFPSMLNQLLKQKFDNSPDISNDYKTYIENWVEGKLGGNYKLEKKDVILKIGEILLNPFTVSPKKVQSKHDSFEIWNSVIDYVDLTIVRNEPFTISKICQPLNMIIEETLSTNIDTITKSINVKNGDRSILDHMKDPIKSYLFEELRGKLRNEIPLDLVYKIFWKAGRIPLLLSSENKEDCKGLIFDVIIFMKQMGIHKKFLLKSADLHVNHIKGNMRVFTSLDDIKDLLNLDKLKIRVTESFSIPLSTIHETDPFFFKWVTPNIVFDICLGKYSLKPNHSVKKNKIDVIKLILNEKLKDELQDHLYPQRDLPRINSRGYVEKLQGIDPGLF